MTRTLIHMDEKQFSRAKKLIRRLCANYDGGNCLLLDDGEAQPCPQLISYSLLCRYFRAAVLPGDRELYGQVMGGPARMKRCAVCGQLFYPGGNRARYCAVCARKEARRRTRERVRRFKARR